MHPFGYTNRVRGRKTGIPEILQYLNVSQLCGIAVVIWLACPVNRSPARFSPSAYRCFPSKLSRRPTGLWKPCVYSCVIKMLSVKSSWNFTLIEKLIHVTCELIGNFVVANSRRQCMYVWTFLGLLRRRKVIETRRIVKQVSFYSVHVARSTFGKLVKSNIQHQSDSLQNRRHRWETRVISGIQIRANESREWAAGACRGQ